MIVSIRATLGFAATLVLCTGSTNPVPDSVTFHHEGLPATTKVQGTFQTGMKMNIDISMGGQKAQSMTVTQSEDTAWNGEMTSATAARVNFTKSTETAMNPFSGAEETKEKPVHGKSYQATFEAGEHKITDAAGKPVSATESEDVAGVVRGSIFDSGIAAVFDGGSVEVGKEITLPNEVARRLLNLSKDEGIDLKECKLTLKETRESGGTTCGAFVAAVTMESAAAPGMPGKLSMEMNGDLLVCTKTSRVVSMQLKGPVSMNGSQDQGGMKVDFAISGEASVSATTHLAP